MVTETQRQVGIARGSHGHLCSQAGPCWFGSRRLPAQQGSTCSNRAARCPAMRCERGGVALSAAVNALHSRKPCCTRVKCLRCLRSVLNDVAFPFVYACRRQQGRHAHWLQGRHPTGTHHCPPSPAAAAGAAGKEAWRQPAGYRRQRQPPAQLACRRSGCVHADPHWQPRQSSSSSSCSSVGIRWGWGRAGATVGGEAAAPAETAASAVGFKQRRASPSTICKPPCWRRCWRQAAAATAAATAAGQCSHHSFCAAAQQPGGVLAH